MAKKKMGRPPTGKPKKELRSLRLHPEFDLRMTRTAYWVRLKINTLIETALEKFITELEVTHNKGKPFPAIPDEDKE